MNAKINFFVCFLAIALAGGLFAYAYGSPSDGILINMNTTGNATSGWTTGVNGTALQFDGIDDYVDAGNVSKLNFGINGNFTVLAWIKTSYLGAGDIITKMNYPNTWGWALSIDYGGTFQIWAENKTGVPETMYIAFIDTNKINDGNWHLGVFRKSGSNFSLWVDGIKVGEQENTNLSHIDVPDNLWIGYGSNQMEFFNGTIDEVRIYNRSLSAYEITSMYEKHWKNKGLTVDIRDGLVGYWNLNEGSGDIAHDTS